MISILLLQLKDDDVDDELVNNWSWARSWAWLCLWSWAWLYGNSHGYVYGYDHCVMMLNDADAELW